MADTQVNQTSGGGNGGMYAILVILAVLVVAAILWFSGVLGGAADQDRDIEADVNIEAPDVTPEGGGGGGAGGGEPPGGGR